MKMFNTNNIAVARRQSGFTLIEIAIVLVIIGLLLGGVLKGQELITTARVHALNNSADGITAAWFSFQDRYRAFPGDYLNAQSTVNLPGGPGGGDGNGQVDTPDEVGFVWIHLVAAGYLTGDFVTPVAVPLDEYGCSTQNCPDNGFGFGMIISYGQKVLTSTVAAHELSTGHGVPVQVIAELDRKIDDGLAASGVMQLGQDGTNWANSGNCLNADNINYELIKPSADCAAVFRNF